MSVRHIAIAGGGASGLLLAHALLRAGARVTIFEPDAQLGSGLAYATQCRLHVLNSPADNMSAIAEEPEHFLAWLAHRGHDANPAAYLPRSLYGEYLHAVAADAHAIGRGRLVHIRALVEAVHEDANGVSVLCDGGQSVRADALVLATGNGNPAPWPRVPDVIRSAPAFFDSAWIARATVPTDKSATVVLLGTGLTAIDAVLSLREGGHRGTIVMISRRGLLPQQHRLFDRPPPAAPSAQTIADVIAAVRGKRRADEADWRPRIDSLRRGSNARWQALNLDEQRRFARHALPYWNVHRHRMAPEVAETIAALMGDGSLRMLAGRTGPLEPAGAGIRVPVTLRGTGETLTLEAGRVINCSGPEHDLSRSPSPLLRSLFAQGRMVVSPLRIGVKIAEDGALVDAEGNPSARLFAIGPLRYGTLIETTAIPEIREQARDLAALLSGTAPRRGAPGELPGPATKVLLGPG